jgi:hypothetical protein
MTRRTGIVLFLIFGLWAAWIYSKEVTLFRCTVLDHRTGTVEDIYVHCGDVFPILWNGEYSDDAPHYFRGPCLKAARGHFAWVIMFGGAAVAFLVTGLVHGRGPLNVDIDTVLRPLPTVSELRSRAGPI